MPKLMGHRIPNTTSAPCLAHKSHPLRARDVQIYQACEVLTECLIYPMVIFSPWAFGTSEPWSIWIMNSAGYCLGALLAVKLAIRHLKGYRPPRWADGGAEPPGAGAARGLLTPARLTGILALLTAAILGYCLISALNARAAYNPETLAFTYRRQYVPWLPHSFDRGATWFAFWSYLGLALSFWAIRDWLLGKSAAEQRPARRANGPGGVAQAEFLPARLRRLLWLLTINGGLLGVEGIIQRLHGSGELLFLVRPNIHKTADTQFGPYAYYANASQYFNLLWPVCLGFWWMLHRSRGFGRHDHYVVLLCCGIMAACPIISTSRGGTLITLGLLGLVGLLLAAAHFVLPASGQAAGRTRATTLGVLALFFVGALALGYSLGWKALKPRMARLSEGFQQRERDYDRARPIAADYPVFGTGPGSFENVSKLYRISPEANWWAQLHNDWLETRITFGWVGSALIALAFATVLLRWFGGGGIYSGRRFVMLLWLALGGCLIHARFDFPFQMHSIVFLFLILCAILFNLSRRPSFH
ncbi:MAG TPA: hypothetical protein DIC50_04595 [Verrucomicrobia subdivision 3 bacterium]|nr:hypothetical protein [Limisphaerales bacterium]